MKIGILTSSRADYGIYFPFLNEIKKDLFFKLEIIAFGTHLSKYHGYTISEIKKNGYKKVHAISTLIADDDKQAIATSYALTAFKFADFWQQNKFDLVFCLGDRFEMSAAVQAGIPFNMNFAHIHGGETTLGAIDDIYRHQITLASNLHFTASEIFSKRIVKLKGGKINVYTIGSLSLHQIEKFKPIPKIEFYKKFKLPNKDFVLITFHPETVNTGMNKQFAVEMRKALSQLTSKLFLVITMPNADTMGSIFRREIAKLKEEFLDHVLCIENFGKENYFNAMFHAKLLIGNSSSGIIEAASFRKYVVNVGNRQEGRLQSKNIVNTSFQHQSIIDGTNHALELGEFMGENLYLQEGAVQKIVEVLKTHHARI
jgi:GDP/UDP-N,N'-diacetylbacillosamine 2-epimerase (hydrolysing)